MRALPPWSTASLPLRENCCHSGLRRLLNRRARRGPKRSIRGRTQTLTRTEARVGVDLPGVSDVKERTVPSDLAEAEPGCCSSGRSPPDFPDVATPFAGSVPDRTHGRSTVFHHTGLHPFARRLSTEDLT
jgi:hypothetical protein